MTTVNRKDADFGARMAEGPRLTPASRITKAFAVLVTFGAIIFAGQPAAAQYGQQGQPLAGTGVPGLDSYDQGASVAVSADGNTAIVGGPVSSGQFNGQPCTCGAAWIFVRSNGVWTQQTVLVPNDGSTFFGESVALSADGNTALVGAPGQAFDAGGAWIYTRNNGVWTQQQKLFGTGAVGGANQGMSVALSSDGLTAAIGGPGDNSNVGAVWVFIQSSGVWSPQGAKLLGTGAVGLASQGVRVALSSDGNTLIEGGFTDNSVTGAAWVFTRAGGVWTQQGPKLVGSGGTGQQQQGIAVSLSADGNTAALGGPIADQNVGGAWVFTRGNGVWTQQGVMLVGNGYVGGASQGNSVSLSADGATLIAAGPNDNTETGAIWIFSQSGGIWHQLGTKLIGTPSSQYAGFGWSVALAAGGSSLIVGAPGGSPGGETYVFVPGLPPPVVVAVTGISPRGGPATGGTKVNISGENFTSDAVVHFGSAAATSVTFVNSNLITAISPPGNGIKDVTVTTFQGTSATSAADQFIYPAVHDFNGDGTTDILWRDIYGDVTIWFMSGGSVASGVSLGNVPTAWSIVGTGDFNDDGLTDILWRDTSGDTTIWFGPFTNGHVAATQSVGNLDPAWTVIGVGDFNGDGMSDILWRDTEGDTAIWFLVDGRLSQIWSIGQTPLSMTVAGIGDFDGDGFSDILWRDASGNTAIWYMDGRIKSTLGLGNIPTAWSVVGTADFNGDHVSDILWRDIYGDTTIWFMNNGIKSATSLGNIPTAWSVAGTGDFNGDGQGDILWRDTSGDTTIWLMNDGSVTSSVALGNVPTAWSVQSTNAE